MRRRWKRRWLVIEALGLLVAHVIRDYLRSPGGIGRMVVT